MPLIGVGLLYRHGYFTQSLSAPGWQAERYPAGDPNGLPLALLRDGPDGTGEPVRITVGLADGAPLAAQIWLAQVGRVPLLLLDSYIEENEPALREVTDRLYGGGSDHRLHQELLLGIGGVRAVRRFCALTGRPQPEVFHTNEGHAGFLGLERIRELTMCRADVRRGAHRLPGGHRVHHPHAGVRPASTGSPVELIERQFGGSNEDPALPCDQVLALGAETYPGGDPNLFNMAVMGMRLAQRVNGVSKLHGSVSRGMFTGLWPGFDQAEVPIGSVTNGVHAPTWVATEILELAAAGAQAGGAGAAAERAARTACPRTAGLGADRRGRPAAIFQIRRLLRARLVAEARRRLRASWRQRGASDAELTWIDEALDENVLTIGFARRVPSYKRLTLMLRDQERLTELLLDPERPVQIVIAGKAHPADDGGKLLIQQMVKFTDDPGSGTGSCSCRTTTWPWPHALVQGCDVLAEQPAAAAGGVRHLGHEVGAERRPEPVDQGRLVGRVVRRRATAGPSRPRTA